MPPADGTANPVETKGDNANSQLRDELSKIHEGEKEGEGKVAGPWLIQTKLGGRDSFCKDPFEKTAPRAPVDWERFRGSGLDKFFTLSSARPRP